MEDLILVEEGIGVCGPCGCGPCTVSLGVYEFCEYGYYTRVDCISSISFEDSDEKEVPFTISGYIGDVEYEGVSMLEGAMHYIVNCKLKRNGKGKGDND